MTRSSIFWFRRDLRLSDNPGLAAAAKSGALIPVFILDPETERLGAAHKWRLGKGLEALDQSLRDVGSRLLVRRGDALDVLRTLVADSDARSVHWSRLYDPDAIARDTKVKAGLRDTGIEAHSHSGHLLFEPWTVETGQGGYYKVYTPFWKNVRTVSVPSPRAVPEICEPDKLPRGLTIASLELGKDMRRGADVVARFNSAGERAAQDRLHDFIRSDVSRYRQDRDRLDIDGTSGLSAHLALGEISARTCWHAAKSALEDGGAGAETFMKELVWREFAYHLIYHSPHIVDRAWRPEWETFPWRGDNEDAERWRRGCTGEPVIDAAMRELYVTGRMHNRARMLVASYLTKHLMTDWRVGRDWFAECLTDWDPASNAMGWQWAAGSGPDAAPYFRVFNPETQGEKFDPLGNYRARFLQVDPEDPSDLARLFFDAIPRSWNMAPDDPTPEKLIELGVGRQRALDAYKSHRSGQ